MSWQSFQPYVSAAERRAQGLKKLKALQAKGLVIEPLGELSHRIKIATSFWGRSWCRHLESFSDYDNRLPRGRTYVRNGSVLHLGMEKGTVSALVQGSELYELSIRIDPIDPQKWQAIQTRCRGKIGSLIELLQGRISDEIMAVVTDQKDGLFPSPKEIHLNCNCPDWATMCKHAAAVLYGVGARLDTAPELLFTLRGMDHNELIALDDTAVLAGSRRSSRRRTLDASSISNVFGIELDAAPPENPPPSAPEPAPKTKKIPTTESNSGKRPAPEAKPKRRPAGTSKSSPAQPEPPHFRADGLALRALRAALGQSRTTFARTLKVSVATLTRWEQSSIPPAIPKPVQTKLNHLRASVAGATH